MDLIGSFKRLKSSLRTILKDVPPRVARQLLHRFQKEETPPFKRSRRKTSEGPLPQSSPSPKTSLPCRLKHRRPETSFSRCRCKRNSSQTLLPFGGCDHAPRHRKLAMVPASAHMHQCYRAMGRPGPRQEGSLHGQSQERNAQDNAEKSAQDFTQKSAQDFTQKSTQDFTQDNTQDFTLSGVGRKIFAENPEISARDHEDPKEDPRPHVCDPPAQFKSAQEESRKRSVVVESEIPYLINTAEDSLADTIFIHHIKVMIL